MFSKDTFDMEDTQKNVCDLSNNDISENVSYDVKRQDLARYVEENLESSVI